MTPKTFKRKRRLGRHLPRIHSIYAGWGGRIRTCECRYQKPVPYHLATPQCVRASGLIAGGEPGESPYSLVILRTQDLVPAIARGNRDSSLGGNYGIDLPASP